MSSYGGYGSAYNSPAAGHAQAVTTAGGQTIQPGSITYTTTTDASGVVPCHVIATIFALCPGHTGYREKSGRVESKSEEGELNRDEILDRKRDRERARSSVD